MWSLVKKINNKNASVHSFSATFIWTISQPFIHTERKKWKPFSFFFNCTVFTTKWDPNSLERWDTLGKSSSMETMSLQYIYEGVCVKSTIKVMTALPLPKIAPVRGVRRQQVLQRVWYCVWKRWPHLHHWVCAVSEEQEYNKIVLLCTHILQMLLWVQRNYYVHLHLIDVTFWP